jgi:hypothetical protein
MNYYKRIERKNKKIEKKLKSAQSVYAVVKYAKWCVREYKWTGRFMQRDEIPWIMPEVYHWTDHNGEYDQWYTCPICNTTSGELGEWTFNKMAADMLADALNAKDALPKDVKPLSKEEEMEEFFKHYA